MSVHSEAGNAQLQALMTLLGVTPAAGGGRGRGGARNRGRGGRGRGGGGSNQRGAGANPLQTRYDGLVAIGRQRGLYGARESALWAFRVGRFAPILGEAATAAEDVLLRRELCGAYWALKRLTSFAGHSTVAPDGSVVPPPERLGVREVEIVRAALAAAPAGDLGPIGPTLDPGMDLEAVLRAPVVAAHAPPVVNPPVVPAQPGPAPIVGANPPPRGGGGVVGAVAPVVVAASPGGGVKTGVVVNHPLGMSQQSYPEPLLEEGVTGMRKHSEARKGAEGAPLRSRSQPVLSTRVLNLHF